ncbi:MAG: DUF1405 domain-containing protein [bacterium]|nr:DUF1405 domain-containing protein [bacterium]
MNLIKAIFILLCFISFFFGYSSYSKMFPEFNPALWVFIPDCPLYVALLLIIVVLDIKSDAFRFLTGAGLVKYGLWTLMIFALYPEYYFSDPLATQTMILIFGHVLMVLSSLIIIPKKIDLRILLLVLLWFLINDFMDYEVGTLPGFPEGHLDVVIQATVALSLLSVFAVYKLSYLRDLEVVEWLRLKLGVSK